MAETDPARGRICATRPNTASSKLKSNTSFHITYQIQNILATTDDRQGRRSFTCRIQCWQRYGKGSRDGITWISTGFPATMMQFYECDTFFFLLVGWVGLIKKSSMSFFSPAHNKVEMGGGDLWHINITVLWYLSWSNLLHGLVEHATGK